MAQPASRVAERLARGVRQLGVAPAPFKHALPRSSLHTSVLRSASRAPALADIELDGAATFDAKQAEFREKQAAARQKAASQSPSERSGSRGGVSASEVASAKASSMETALNSPSFPIGESREAARQTDNTSGSAAESGDQGKRRGTLSSIIYGTEEGREHEQEIERSFSQTLARGKYVHSITFHEVKPGHVNDYVELIGNVYPSIANDPKNNVHLVGSWRTEVGDSDTFVHIWEYNGYQGYHSSLHAIKHNPAYPNYEKKLSSLINSKKTSLMQEFSFWPTTSPRQLGGLFELRSYQLHPGNLLEWETHWRRGLEARREVMEGVGAWFVQIGDLNTVHHLWQYANLEERKQGRERSWAVPGWSDTVHKTVPLIQTMKSRILMPMPWSPIG